MINKVTLIELKARFKDRKKVNKSNIPAVPLKGHLKCSKCSTNLTAYLVKSKNLWYYKCNTHGCKQNISATKIHQHWRSTLTDLQLDPKFIEPIAQNFILTLDIEKDNYEKDRQVTTQKVKEYKKQIQTVEDNYALGKITEEVQTRVLADIQEKLFPLQAELAKGVFKLSNHEEMVVSAVTNLTNLDYNSFKKTVDSMFRNQTINCHYDLESVVPGKFWGVKNSTTGSQEMEYDFMHFTGEGHRLLYDSLHYKMIVNSN